VQLKNARINTRINATNGVENENYTNARKRTTSRFGIVEKMRILVLCRDFLTHFTNRMIFSCFRSIACVCCILAMQTTMQTSTFTLFAQQRADPLTVAVVRDFGGELFLLNSVKYLNPLVQLLNSSVNARMYHSAEIARQNSFYVRVGIHGMVGFVNPDQLTYVPELPRMELDFLRLSQYATVFPTVSIRDTAGLIGYAMRVIINDGIKDGQIQVPSASPTFFGSLQQRFTIPKAYFRQRLLSPAAGDPLAQLSPALRASVVPYIERLPNDYPLPDGQNLSLLPLVVPQVEIGSLFGTELLLRYLPQINWGNNIGNFGFGAIGLKHSISQYLKDAPLHVALQAVYQGTTLTNTIGVTGARLQADANIFTANLHASKRWGNFEVYGGAAFDNLTITASYTFVIPRELQAQLGLLQLQKDAQGNDVYVENPGAGYPGDTLPQTKIVALSNSAFRGTLGVAYYLGPVAISLDYNRSSFNLISAGIDVKF
jgi:hypothetical protein